MKDNEKSNTFVSEDGELICYVSRTEKFRLYIRAVFKALPFIAVFVICSLFLVEFACLWGLCESLCSPQLVPEECALYGFVFIGSCIIQLLGLGIGWQLAEIKDVKVRPKTHQPKTNQQVPAIPPHRKPPFI